ncbi:hypothetical protein SBRCBS47491_003518 [Sporothrix bragantina]|uniref:Uncharacterized protein n=1 Tax=Sporothrix bragantina TaxID=671064 RepID=A0ABP0BG21_9PEZI
MSIYEPNVTFAKLFVEDGLGQQQRLDWWRAQCAFRGLPTDGEERFVLETRRRGHASDVMCSDFAALETQAKEVYKARNDAEFERHWNDPKRMNLLAKIKTDAMRFVNEELPPNPHGNEGGPAIVLKGKGDEDAGLRPLVGDRRHDEAAVAQKAAEQTNEMAAFQKEQSPSMEENRRLRE